MDGLTPFLSFTVIGIQEGCTVGRYLRREYGVSRTLLRRLRKEGTLRVNGHVAGVDRVLHEGDEVELFLPLDAPVAPEPGPLQIVYEDPHLLVVEKPAGVLVHPTDMEPGGSLLARAVHHLKQQGAPPFAGPVTRLDRETSGLVLLAKHPHAHYRLARALEEGRLARGYLAVVHGWVEGPAGTIDAPIRRVPGSLSLREVAPNGQRAVTHFSVVGQYGRAALRDETKNAAVDDGRVSLLRLRLETGRTHQIRVHMAHIGHPLVGDKLYGPRSVAGGPDMARQALHAAELILVHPVTGKELQFTSPLPPDMRRLLEPLDVIENITLM